MGRNVQKAPTLPKGHHRRLPRRGTSLSADRYRNLFCPREVGMFSAAWKMLKDTVLAFINDEALSRGAAIAFYTVTSIAPVLLIVIAIAGLAFGRDAAQNAITEQLSGLMGQQTAEVLQTAVASAASTSSGVMATTIGIVTLMVTASGVFGEMQTALNAIWKAEPKGTTVSQLIRARAVSLGLVAALGFLLMVSLVVSTGLTAFGIRRCRRTATHRRHPGAT